ncbi:MAG: type II secretion system protein [Planctomycetota bacterium]
MTPASQRRGFTLVELLVVIGIIALLVGILLPTLSRARQSANDIKCASNMRTLAQSMTNYSIDFNSRYSTNFYEELAVPGNPLAGQRRLEWLSVDRIGRYLPPDDLAAGTDNLFDGVFVCPSDESEARRSYAMNAFASSDLHAGEAGTDAEGNGRVPDDLFDKLVVTPNASTGLPRGQQWSATVRDATSMILFGEAWQISRDDSTGDTFARPVIGGPHGVTPAAKFIEVQFPDFPNALGYARMASDIDYSRHGRDAPEPDQPQIRGAAANFAFADGHVELLNSRALVEIGDESDPDTWISTGKAKWSPLDDRLIEFEASR